VVKNKDEWLESRKKLKQRKRRGAKGGRTRDEPAGFGFPMGGFKEQIEWLLEAARRRMGVERGLEGSTWPGGHKAPTLRRRSAVGAIPPRLPRPRLSACEPSITSSPDGFPCEAWQRKGGSPVGSGQSEGPGDRGPRPFEMHRNSTGPPGLSKRPTHRPVGSTPPRCELRLETV
jgi:hypothetical protein